ncbi:MAG TPA: hypothetical protein VKE73_00130 [Myxococcota bacterium]|nr:hypothetical protein [Myxococcota bacterium]
MVIDLKAVRLRDAAHGVCELPDVDRLIVHSGQALVAVAWSALGNTSGGVAIALGPEGYGKVLAAGVAVDNAWTVEPRTQRVLLAREGALESLDPSAALPPKTTVVGGLPRGSFAVAVDPEGRRVLLSVMRVVNPDFANYAVVLVDLRDGRLVREGSIGSVADLELLWDRWLGTWVVGDTGQGGMWRWDGATPAVRLDGPPGGPVHAASFAATNEGVMVSALVTQDGTTALVTGLAGQDRVHWASPVRLPGPPVVIARRDPSAARWACLAQEGRAQQVQIRDPAGGVLAEVRLGSSVQLENVRWSTSLPDHVWGIGVHAIAGISLKD